MKTEKALLGAAVAAVGFSGVEFFQNVMNPPTAQAMVNCAQGYQYNDGYGYWCCDDNTAFLSWGCCDFAAGGEYDFCRLNGGTVGFCNNQANQFYYSCYSYSYNWCDNSVGWVDIFNYCPS